MKKILSLLLLTSSIFSMELVKSDKLIKPSSVFVPNKLGEVELYHGKKGFYVKKNNEKRHVKKYFTDQLLHNIDKKQLRSFLENGYLHVNQMDDGEYSLRAKGRINGGGPITGTVAYWMTKSLLYGTAAAAVTTAAVTTGGAVMAAATGAAAAVSGSAFIATLSTEVTVGAVTTITSIETITGITTLAGVSTITAATGGATAVAGAITTAGLAGEAAVATAAVVSSTGSIAAALAAVESASLGIGVFFTMMPMLP